MSAALPADLVKSVVLLAAGVAAVPLFRRLGLGSVLGYLAAGVLVGPAVLGVFQHPETILHLAEMGVVMFLFVIGLEMQPSRLWRMRQQIFGLGLTQVLVCGAVLAAAGMLMWQMSLPVAFIAGMGFVLSSTAIVMQLLQEQGSAGTPRGQRIVAILLLEDLAIVPLLALVALLAPGAAQETAATAPRWLPLAVALAALVGLVAVSRWLLNPVFALLARSGAREVMTAAALLVVLGSALAMQAAGLSMAMGAFAAGVMLSESSFRHQLEADIEPFRGLLLGLFFMGVGMSLDLALVRSNWPTLLGGVVSYMLLKGLGIYAVARLAGARRGDALERAALMAQGGEFAFVLYAAATQAGLFTPGLNAALTAAIILSMALTPLLVGLIKRLPLREAAADLSDVEVAEGLSGTVLMIGFGRFGQIAGQALLARGHTVSIIETDTEMIRAAATFGFKVYFGDGTRLDVLHASGAAEARAILVCVNDKAAASRIVELARHAFPQVPVLARAYDRQHLLELARLGATVQVRETYDAALAFSEAALETLGESPEDIASLVAHVRSLDVQRRELEQLGGITPDAVRQFLSGARWTPTPLTAPAHAGQAMNAEAQAALAAGHPLAGELRPAPTPTPAEPLSTHGRTDASSPRDPRGPGPQRGGAA